MYVQFFKTKSPGLTVPVMNMLTSRVFVGLVRLQGSSDFCMACLHLKVYHKCRTHPRIILMIKQLGSKLELGFTISEEQEPKLSFSTAKTTLVSSIK